MLLNIHSLTGEEHVISVDPQDKVSKVKEVLEECSGTPVMQQRLLFQGKKMKDDEVISRYKLQKGSVIQLVVALRAG